MGNISPGGDSSTNGTIRYPIDALMLAAAKILAQADNARSQHEAQWTVLRIHIQSLPTSLQETLYDFMYPPIDLLALLYLL